MFLELAASPRVDFRGVQTDRDVFETCYKKILKTCYLRPQSVPGPPRGPKQHAGHAPKVPRGSATNHTVLQTKINVLLENHVVLISL